MKHSWFDTFMSWYWGVWFLVGFGVMEGIALATKRYQNTLSEWTWRVFEVVPGQTVWQYRFAHILLLAFLTWAWFHLCFALFR